MYKCVTVSHCVCVTLLTSASSETFEWDELLDTVLKKCRTNAVKFVKKNVHDSNL